MNRVTIAVTGLNAIDSPGPGVGVIRCLREATDLDVRIIGLSYESLEPGIYMRDLVDKVYQIPYPSAGSAQLLQRLAYIHQQEQLNFVLPNFDAELLNFITIAEELKRMGIHSFLPSRKELQAIDKLHLYEFGVANGLSVPTTVLVNSFDKLVEAEAVLGYPMVVKGKFYEATVCRSRQEAEAAYFKLLAKWGLPIVLQEFIAGTEIDIAALGDGSGNLIGAVPMRKLYITDKGKGWAGVTLQDDSLLEFAEQFIRASHWKGGFELEIMRDEGGGLHLMEINPRFPAWIYTTAAAGQNLPAALVHMGLGQKCARLPSYTPGKLFVRYSWDLVTDIELYHQLATTGEL